jgi:superfamily II DNA or RNA helicase
MAGYYSLDIAEITKQRASGGKQPFSHQKDAFSELAKTLPTPISGYRGTLLVLPTGGGKTFTSVNWICRNILAKGIKVLWLAQSSYLIDQATDSFIGEIHNAIGRNTINLRVVSSSTEHSNAGSIALTDDVLVCTTQTAISAYNAKPLDGAGNEARSPFYKFVDNCADSELFVVIDEAHHTPAYGCRTLLLDLRTQITNLYILGLTATPMHMDKRISGWLTKIYDHGNYGNHNKDLGICYAADKSTLQALKILAVENYIEKSTGVEFEVDDSLYDRLVNKHKDLPENIIELLTQIQGRNNLIVSDYISNKAEYGKTIIFADRAAQCEYISDKLNSQGVRAGAVYTVIAGQSAPHHDGSGRSNNNEHNRKIMQDFRDGKLDVVVNVRMLTEGVDVPDVKTVMITRQTTSNILMTQMIGRALRGEKAGGGVGKDYANIVFFCDTWKRLLPPLIYPVGGKEEGKPDPAPRYPMEFISTQLIRLAIADIEYKCFENAPYLTFIPVGFFGCEYTVAIAEGTAEEELVSFAESIVVYEFNRDKYDAMLEYISTENLTQYAEEKLSDDDLAVKAEELAAKYFEVEKDGFDGMLIDNIAKLIRHVAQNGTTPEFLDFHERDVYDLAKIARSMLSVPPIDANILLKNMFNNEGLHWGLLYKTYLNFKKAYDNEVNIIFNPPGGDVIVETIFDEPGGELTEALKEQVFTRDKHTCLCCGKTKAKGKKIALQVDHIIPVAMGGKNVLSNLQTLCRTCNTAKGVNEVDYRNHVTPRGLPKSELKLNEPNSNDEVENAVARVVNEFYHCAAMAKLQYHKTRNGQNAEKWRIELYSDNNPEWLIPHVVELRLWIKQKFPQYAKMYDIEISN